jgi:purine catabolism regulator
MITVADVLSLDVLSRAKLIAGAAGLDHTVRWIHVVEEPDVTRWVRGGEILLTTGQSLAQDPGLQESIIGELTGADLAGIFIATGRYLPQVPHVMREAGETHGFPVVDVPWDIPFIDIMQTVHELIVNEQYTLLLRRRSRLSVKRDYLRMPGHAASS